MAISNIISTKETPQSTSASASVTSVIGSDNPKRHYGPDAIVALLQSPPAPLSLSREEVEEIAHGKNLMWHLQTIDKGEYLANFLAGLDWWIQVAHALFYQETDYPTQSLRDMEEDKIAEKLTGILTLFPVAFAGRYIVDAVGSDPTGLELMRRNYEFTRYICTLVQRDFHDTNWSALLALA